MIDLYTWSTPNGRKVSIMLEECGLDYQTIPVDIGAGDQFAPEFLKISPNNKIPAIVDKDEDIAMMESGAILLYLADRTGRLKPGDPQAYWEMVQWLMWQKAGFGPMLAKRKPVLVAIDDATARADARRLAFEIAELRARRDESRAGDPVDAALLATVPA